jgi:thymidylate kinase
MSVVAIIGVDGSGKSTQVKMLVERLRSEGINAEHVRPNRFLFNKMFRIDLSETPFYSPRRNRVSHKNIRSNKKINIFKRGVSSFLGYFYIVISHLSMKLYARRRILVCDRYFYQTLFDLFGKSVYRIIPILPKARIVFFLNAPPETLLARMNSAFDQTVSPGYYAEVREFMSELSKRKRFIEIDASKEPQTINDEIFAVLAGHDLRAFKLNEG